MPTEMGNFFKGELLSGKINMAALGDTCVMILMATGFTFDKDTHNGYSDVSANELADGNGYTTRGVAMTGQAVAVDNSNDRADASWDNVVWSASGGNIGPSPGSIIFDDTHATDAIAGFIDFGGDQTATDGGTFTVANPVVRIA